MLSVGDGIARIYGLKGVKAGELVRAQRGGLGFAGPSLFVSESLGPLAGLPGSSKYTDVNCLDKTNIDDIKLKSLECCWSAAGWRNG